MPIKVAGAEKFPAKYFLQLAESFLVIALLAYGLMARARFVWVAALFWQAIRAGFGVINLTLNDYEPFDYTQFTGIGFYRIVLPIGVAVTSFVLLLLPTTTRWVRSR